MKALITGITHGMSEGASVECIYKVYDVKTNGNDYVYIGNYNISKQDCILFKDDEPIPTIEYNSDNYELSSEYEDEADYIIVKAYILNNYNKLVGNEYLSNEDFCNKFIIQNNNTSIYDFKKGLKDFFGDRVDVSHNEQFIVYFPEKTISNSSGRKHTIYDIYVKVIYEFGRNNYRSKLRNVLYEEFQSILENKIQTTTFHVSSGTRTKCSKEEIDSGYLFSHFSRRYGDWKSVCLGEGILNKYKTINITNEETLIGFCMSLENYLSWESLEGGPYIKMSEIRTNNSISVQLPSSNDIKARLLQSLTKRGCHDLIRNIDRNIVLLNQLVFDEINSFYTINGQYCSVDFLKTNNTISQNKIEKAGGNFFTFNGQLKGEITVDYSLNKNVTQEILSGELKPFDSYNDTKLQLTKTINQIINDKSNNFLEKKPLFRID